MVRRHAPPTTRRNIVHRSAVGLRRRFRLHGRAECDCSHPSTHNADVHDPGVRSASHYSSGRAGINWWANTRRHCRRGRPRSSAVRGTAARGWLTGFHPICGPHCGPVVLGAHLKHVQSGSPLGRGGKYSVGRQGCFRRRRVVWQRRCIPRVRRQARTDISSGQRRPGRRVRPL